jgi:hypothetical protein
MTLVIREGTGKRRKINIHVWTTRAYELSFMPSDSSLGGTQLGWWRWDYGRWHLRFVWTIWQDAATPLCSGFLFWLIRPNSVVGDTTKSKLTSSVPCIWRRKQVEIGVNMASASISESENFLLIVLQSDDFGGATRSIFLDILCNCSRQSYGKSPLIKTVCDS